MPHNQASTKETCLSLAPFCPFLCCPLFWLSPPSAAFDRSARRAAPLLAPRQTFHDCPFFLHPTSFFVSLKKVLPCVCSAPSVWAHIESFFPSLFPLRPDLFSVGVAVVDLRPPHRQSCRKKKERILSGRFVSSPFFSRIFLHLSVVGRFSVFGLGRTRPPRHRVCRVFDPFLFFFATVLARGPRAFRLCGGRTHDTDNKQEKRKKTRITRKKRRK